MTEQTGQDQFQPVANRRAGYSHATEWALKIAKKGGTLAAGEGLLVVMYYEEQIAQLVAQLAEREPHRTGRTTP